jgi:heme-degrading monooxygenase HmoA/catechol 2,3-dioxygenase-like lactoylglutathione lyase family enzyme
MILESAILDVKPGESAAFEAAFAKARPIITAAAGCLSCELRRSVETPGRYLLLVRWRSLEDHTAGFRGSRAYQDWRALLHHFYDPMPTVEHYEPLEVGGAVGAPVEVIGIDHVYLTVRDLARSEAFYDRVMAVLGYRKVRSTIGGDPHVHFYNRQFGFSLRPAHPGTPEHDPYAPGLHHFCFRVEDERAVDRAAAALEAIGVDVVAPRYYPEYSADYYATFFTDPDGVRLEITNFREIRRRRMFDWDSGA